MNEAKESFNVSFLQQQAMMQMNNSSNLVEDGAAFSWDDETKLDSVFQFQFSGIQIEERDHQNQSSDDFAAYSLPQNMNVFDHRIQTVHTNTETQL